MSSHFASFYPDLWFVPPPLGSWGKELSSSQVVSILTFVKFYDVNKLPCNSFVSIIKFSDPIFIVETTSKTKKRLWIYRAVYIELFRKIKMDLALSLFGNHSTEGYISGKDIASVSCCLKSILCLLIFLTKH